MDIEKRKPHCSCPSHQWVIRLNGHLGKDSPLIILVLKYTNTQYHYIGKKRERLCFPLQVPGKGSVPPPLPVAAFQQFFHESRSPSLMDTSRLRFFRPPSCWFSDAGLTKGGAENSIPATLSAQGFLTFSRLCA